MTFYWWSHWFWITLLCNVILSITIIHTYPSQEISLEYNQNSKTIKTAITKLYQTSTTLAWGTAAPPTTHKMMGVTRVEKTILQNVTPEMEVEADELLQVNDENDEDEIAVDPDEDRANVDDVEDELAEVDVEEAVEQDENIEEDFEVKRSAENFNRTSVDDEKRHDTIDGGDKTEAEAEDDAATGTVKLKRDETAMEVSNYTNFSSAVSGNATFASTTSGTQTGTNSTQPQLEKPQNDSLAAATLSPPRNIDTLIAQSTLQWLSSMTQQAQQRPQSGPASHIAVTTADDDSENGESVAIAHKVPFTLENVNREDELRRAESEHRSRKSKVLSAEYKHVNRYINFSTDSKNLLTRSASTAPNEFDDGEGNISSEALAIQRTYFLDAGAISAICFTVFGVCCTVGTIGIVLYRRRFVNKPQALSEPDSSVYIDDSTVRVSDNSDEMYSLDNDSFLNSLEAMTIQNYWTDTVKHTKL